MNNTLLLMIKPLFFTACEKFFQMHFSFTVGIIIDNMINRKDDSKYIYLGRWRLVRQRSKRSVPILVYFSMTKLNKCLKMNIIRFAGTIIKRFFCSNFDYSENTINGVLKSLSRWFSQP